MAHKLPLADIQFIADFAAFCRTKGDEGYDFDSTSNCAGAQFVRSMHPNAVGFGTNGWDDADGQWHDTPQLGPQLIARPQTFSALADRLEALIADAPVVERAQ